MAHEEDLLNAAQAATYLGVSRQRIYELTDSGRLGKKIAGYWLYTRAELDEYIAQRETNKGGRPKHEAGPLTAVHPA